MRTREQTSARLSAAAHPRTRQRRPYGPGRRHGLFTALTPHGRRLNSAGRVISPADSCGSIHTDIGVVESAPVNVPKTGASSHIWRVGRAPKLAAPYLTSAVVDSLAGLRLRDTRRTVVASMARVHQHNGPARKLRGEAGFPSPGFPASTGSTRSLDRGASLTARVRLTSSTQVEARCDQAAASPVAFHSVFGKTASTSHRGGRRRARRGLSHCGVRESASLASVRAGGLRGVVGALSHNGGSQRAKRINGPSLRTQRMNPLLPEVRGAATFYCEAMQ